MNQYTQDIKIICQNHIIKGSVKASAGHPWRSWKIRVVAVDNNQEKKGKLTCLLDHVEYILHPTFENPQRVFMNEPYVLQEKGWGEFDMRVVLFFKNNLAEPENIFFDLHFREPTYTILHTIHFINPPPELIHLLSMEFPTSDMLASDPKPPLIEPTHTKKRRTSPSLNAYAKKVKTPPSMSSPYDNSPFNFYNNNNNKYPASPSVLHNSTMYGDQKQDNMDSIDLFRAIHGFRLNREDGIIIDDVYEEKDLENVNPIHTKPLDDHVRMAWGIPEGVDMMELAKRLSTRTSYQTEEIETMIKSHKRDVEENDDEFVVDLYSLGPELLTQLWDYTERKMNSKTALSPFSLVQANTTMIDYE